MGTAIRSPRCLRKPTSSSPSLTAPSSSSRKLSVSWMLTRMVFCQPQILLLLEEVDGPMNFTQMVPLFATKMAGGSDDDDVILASFEAFEMDGKIDADAFRHSLMTFGVKFSASEVDDAFAEMKIDEGMIDAAHLKGLMVSK